MGTFVKEERKGRWNHFLKSSIFINQVYFQV